MKRRLTLGLSGNSQSFGGCVNDMATGEPVWKDSTSYADGIAKSFGIADSFVSDGAGGWFWSPAMTAAGLDAILFKCKEALGPDMENICAISGGFHQHSRFDTNASVARVLGAFNPSEPLAIQIAPMLTSQLFPCWMHAGTAAESRAIADSAGGNMEVARITGSAVTPRFVLSPLRRASLINPNMFWAPGQKLHSGSSFIPSLLCQRLVGVDRTEASAWNLMDITTGTWSKIMCRDIGPALMSRLPAILDPLTHVGNVGPYFQQKYGFRSDCKVFSFSGDNIVSLLGNGVTSPGTTVLSLGTSWTLIDLTEKPGFDPSLLGHVMGAWIGGFMRMTCQTNGGKSMKHFRDDLRLGADWGVFDALLSQQTIDPDKFVIPYVFDEGLGNKPKGIRYVGISDQKDVKTVVPGVVHALFASLILGSADFFGDITGKTVLATGGGSCSKALLQAAANMLGADVLPSLASDTVALGGSLGAGMAYLRDADDHAGSAVLPGLYKQHGNVVKPVPGLEGLRADLIRRFSEALR